MPIKSYRDLVAWQKAMVLVTEVYRVTHDFPKEELFGLTSQLRKAAVSIPSNIAEGRGRSSLGEFRLFLGNAMGSLAEVETQLFIAMNLKYIDEPTISNLLNLSSEIGRVLNGLIASISKRRSDSRVQAPILKIKNRHLKPET
jgi:four helix bundle protein